MRIRPNVKVFAGPLEVAPLVNVFFLLLIFFVISSSLVFQPGISVELPTSAAAEYLANDKLVITVTDLGQLFFNDQPVAWDELERELRELVLHRKELMARRAGGLRLGRPARAPMVILRLDRRAPYEQAMAVLSMARSLNLGVCLATAVPRPPAGLLPVPKPRVAGAE
ncbi:MAG: biopolymer transporter ExbD [Lentisphaeria bacterium]